MTKHICNTKSICPRDVNVSGGLQITNPGYYVLGKDIIYNPSQTGTTAITIGASNVVLDFCSHTLSQRNNMGQTTALKIKTG